ncbi:MAG TPA: DUF1579 family protein, partial [Myxococcota bacterium]
AAAPAAPAKEAAKPEAAAAPAAVPPPAADLAKNLKVMEGKWKCDGKFPESPAGKAHTAKATYETKSDLGGYWYLARYEEKKSKDNPVPYAMATEIGFDPSKGELIRTDVDNIGAVTHLTSKGFDGDKLVWTGESMAGPSKQQFKETQTKKSDKEIDISMELAGADGTFASIGEIVCKK